MSVEPSIVDPVPVPPAEPICIRRPADVVPKTRGWTQNNRDTVFSAPWVFTADDVPPGIGIRDEGFADIQSVHPVRMDGGMGEANEELCAYQMGTMALGADGFGVAVFCHDPHNDGRNQNAVGYPVIATAEMIAAAPSVGLELGFCYFVAGFETPPVVETWFWSQRNICPGPPA